MMTSTTRPLCGSVIAWTWGVTSVVSVASSCAHRLLGSDLAQSRLENFAYRRQWNCRHDLDRLRPRGCLGEAPGHEICR
jgi:hypothetical protein